MKLIKDLGTLYPTSTSKARRRFGIYECPVCLKGFKTQTDNVKQKKTTKCKSCSAIIKNTTHGMGNTKLYSIHSNMLGRCYTETNTAYKTHGAKGVTVTQEWHKFEPFMEWSLNNGYKEGLVLDKDKLCEELGISPKIYSPSTCEWVIQKENADRSISRKHDNTNTKINMDDASELVEAYETGMFTYKELAEALPYKITPEAIFKIVAKSRV